MAGQLTIDSGDTAWMLVSTAFVMLMLLPGLALIYGGLVRAKNLLSVMSQVLGITALAFSFPRVGRMYRLSACMYNQFPMNAPTMPTSRSPMIPKPVPRTILPASHPATMPTSKMTSRL
jgi:hypothetical protein